MVTYRKAWFGDKPFIISSVIDKEIQKLSNAAGVIVINQPDDRNIAMCIRDIRDKETEAIIILTKEVEHYWQKVMSQFEYMEAGGGLVENKRGEWLFIFRRGYWDLPKGKMDAGETIDSCAIREVLEETGLRSVAIKSFITDTYHVYTLKNRSILKKTTWFYMQNLGSDDVTPQTEEDISELGWKKPNKLSKILANSYASVREVVQQQLLRQPK